MFKIVCNSDYMSKFNIRDIFQKYLAEIYLIKYFSRKIIPQGWPKKIAPLDKVP